MGVVMNDGDRAFNQAVLEVQQQFLAHRERTSHNLQKLEDTLEIARQKMQKILSIKTRGFGEGSMNPLGWQSEKKSNYSQPSSKELGTQHHLNLRFPKSEEGSVVFETDFGIGNKAQEWPNQEENAHVVWEAYTGDPIYDVYDEEQVKGQECWPEQEFILAALNGGNLDAPNPLQTKICRRGRSEELAEFSNFQQENVSPGDMNIIAYNNMQLCRERKYLEMSAGDLCIFHSTESSTNVLGNSLTWSTEDKEMPSVSKNSNGKFKLNGHFPFLDDEEGNYNDLRNLPEPSRPTMEDVPNLKPILMAENAILLERNDLSSPLSCPSGELEWTEGVSIYASHTCDMKFWVLTITNSYGLGSLAIYCDNNVRIFDPGGGYVQTTNSKGVKLMEKIRHKMTLDDVAIIISFCGQLEQLQDMNCWKLTIDQLLMEHHLRRKVFMIQMVNADRNQGVGHWTDRVVSEINQHVDFARAGKKVILKYSTMGQIIPEMDRIMRLEDHETSRKSFERTTFDPGGYIICVYEAQLVDGTAGIFMISTLLHEIFFGNEFLLKGQEGIVVDVLTERYVIQVKRSLEVHDPP